MSAQISKGRLQIWGRLMGGIARRAGMSLLVAGAAASVAGIILWDADFYVARDRWEHFKLAMFGEWPVKRSKNVDDIFEEVDEINLFRRSLVPGLGVIITGSEFTSSETVNGDRADSKWCYVTIGNGVTATRINLGDQDGENPPEYSDTGTIDPKVLNEIGISAVRLVQLAKEHCRFS